MTNYPEGTEIGVYTTLGRLSGSGVMHKGRAAITIWGDNEKTDLIDGAYEGETLSVMALDPNTSYSRDVVLSSITELSTKRQIDNLVYVRDGIYIASTNDGETQDAASLKVYPNPFNESTNIEWIMTDESSIEVSIYSSDGRLVSVIASSEYETGSYMINFENEELSSGVYY
jgi:hypothetical protein